MGSPNGCVPSFWFCDYWEDCVDASDENCIDGELIEEEGYDVQLYLSSCGGDCVNVMYQPGFVLGGYQFDFTGVTVVGAEGGDSEDADFSISTSDTTVIAFSLTGATVECDDDDDCVLITVEVEDGEEVCIENEIISDSTGEQLSSSSDVCVELCQAGGDVNADGTVDILDVVVMVNEVLDGGNFDDCEMTAADVNEDGNLDVLDIVSVVNEILEGRRNLWGYYYYYGYYYYAYYYYYYYYYYNYYYYAYYYYYYYYYYNYYYYGYYGYYYYYYYYYYNYYYYYYGYYGYYYYNYYYYQYYYYSYYQYYAEEASQDACDAIGGHYCGDDEDNWTVYSPNGCVPSFWFCDYWEDCVDASDENCIDGELIEEEGYDVQLYLSSCGGDCVNVMYQPGFVLGGYQFDFTGVTVTGAEGGDSEDAGFEVSFSADSGNVLAFSFSGDTVECGNTEDDCVLVTVLVDDTDGDGEACIGDEVVSDADG